MTRWYRIELTAENERPVTRYCPTLEEVRSILLLIDTPASAYTLVSVTVEER